MGLAGAVKEINSGAIKVARRPGRSAAAGLDLALAAFNIFNIVGGEILVISLFGRVTTQIAGAAVPRIQFTPTGGVLTPLTGIHGGLAGAVVNTIMYTDGAVASLLASSAVIGVGVIPWGVTVCNQILVPGIISITNTVPATAGVVDWFAAYIPCRPNARVSAL